MSPSNSDYSEDYDEDYSEVRFNLPSTRLSLILTTTNCFHRLGMQRSALQASSYDSECAVDPTAASQEPVALSSSAGSHERVVQVSGSSKTPLCLSDSQKTAIRNRRY